MNASSRAEQLRAKAERLAAAQAKTTTTPTEVPEQQPAAPEPRKPTRAKTPEVPVAVRGKPIRSTVDLPPVRHHSLKSWCDETAVQLGKARVTTQDVMRTLVARLLTDETLARKIRTDLQNGVQ